MATSWTLKNTATATGLSTDMNESMFLDSIYYNLFFNNSYWLSTRNVQPSSTGTVYFSLARLYASEYINGVTNMNLYYSTDRALGNPTDSLRPVITLNANIKITSGSGTEDDEYTIEI